MLNLAHIVISWSRNVYPASFPKTLSENPVFAYPRSLPSLLPPPHVLQYFKLMSGSIYVEGSFWICTAQEKDKLMEIDIISLQETLQTM